MYANALRLPKLGDLMPMHAGYLNALLLPAGENPLPPNDPAREQMGKTEVSLTLTNKFDVPAQANAEMDARTLLLK